MSYNSLTNQLDSTLVKSILGKHCRDERSRIHGTVSSTRLSLTLPHVINFFRNNISLAPQKLREELLSITNDKLQIFQEKALMLASGTLDDNPGEYHLVCRDKNVGKDKVCTDLIWEPPPYLKIDEASKLSDAVVEMEPQDSYGYENSTLGFLWEIANAMESCRGFNSDDGRNSVPRLLGREHASPDQKKQIDNFVMTHCWVIRAQNNGVGKVTDTINDQLCQAHTFRKDIEEINAEIETAKSSGEGQICELIDKRTIIAKKMRNWVREFGFKEYSEFSIGEKDCKPFPQWYCEFLSATGITHLISSTHPNSYLFSIIAKLIQKEGGNLDIGVIPGRKLQRPLTEYTPDSMETLVKNEDEWKNGEESGLSKHAASVSASFEYTHNSESAAYYYYKKSWCGGNGAILGRGHAFEGFIKKIIDNDRVMKGENGSASSRLDKILNIYYEYSSKLNSICQVYLVDNDYDVAETGPWGRPMTQHNDLMSSIKRANVHKANDANDRQFRVKLTGACVPVVRACSLAMKCDLVAFKDRVKAALSITRSTDIALGVLAADSRNITLKRQAYKYVDDMRKELLAVKDTPERTELNVRKARAIVAYADTRTAVGGADRIVSFVTRMADEDIKSAQDIADLKRGTGCWSFLNSHSRTHAAMLAFE